jgi:hypothetical protein
MDSSAKRPAAFHDAHLVLQGHYLLDQDFQTSNSLSILTQSIENIYDDLIDNKGIQYKIMLQSKPKEKIQEPVKDEKLVFESPRNRKDRKRIEAILT